MMGCGIRSFEPQGYNSCFYRPIELCNFTVPRQLVTEEKRARRKILSVVVEDILVLSYGIASVPK
jgi:hypothetical protein